MANEFSPINLSGKDKRQKVPAKPHVDTSPIESFPPVDFSFKNIVDLMDIHKLEPRHGKRKLIKKEDTKVTYNN